MLTQMTDTLDVRHDGRSIDIEHLDITSYLLLGEAVGCFVLPCVGLD